MRDRRLGLHRANTELQRSHSRTLSRQPIKGRRLHDTLAGAPPSGPMVTAVLQPNAGLAAIANIESRVALENLDALLAGAPLLDAVLGAYLSGSMGIEGVRRGGCQCV